MATKKITKTTAKRSTKAKQTTTTAKKKASSKKRVKSASSPASNRNTTSKSSSGGKNPRKKSSGKKTLIKKVDEEMKIDRRQKTDRRVEELCEGADNVAAPALERRKKVQRRRQIDPTTCERDYSVEEVEFMSAMDDYKRKSGRMFPTCSEILEVIRSIDYVKQSPAEQASLIDVQDLETNPEQNDEASTELVGAGFNAPADQPTAESFSWSV